MTTPALDRDPFGDDIVTSPREIEPAVGQLNGNALGRLVGHFEDLCSASKPRLARDRGALLVVSPEPGYGKSHLIGRLFRELDDTATLLYLRPFQDPNSCWVSILEKVVVELDHPDAAHKEHADPGEPTQLDTLVRKVLMSVMTPLLKDDGLKHPNPSEALALFEKYPQTALEMPGFRSWVQHCRDDILASLDKLLRKDGQRLLPTRTAWLKVLLAYAYSESDPNLRQLCLDWITYRELDPEEGNLLGLRRAELPTTDLPYEQRNEKCFERLADLLSIGAYYRPFLLCFDQTELYGATAALARSFGVVVSRLRRETCNQLTVVTGNAAVWQERVARFFELADQHAFDARPIELEGMTETQARELLQNRLDRWEAARDADGFSDRVATTAFKEHARRSVREVLRVARSEWSGEQITQPDVGALFESYRLKLLARPKSLAFDAGVLQWAVENVLGPALDARIERIESPKGYLTTAWTDGTRRRELFGFESGNHWKRWDAIVREAARYHLDAHQDLAVRATFFRFPKQKPLSQRTKKAIQENEKAVHLVELQPEEAASLFAAHDLIADVRQGNQEVFEEEVLTFLRDGLKDLASRVWQGSAAPATLPPPCNLPLLISKLVESKRFVTLALLRSLLPAPHAECSDDDLVSAVADIETIKVHISPSSKLLQWLQ